MDEEFWGIDDVLPSNTMNHIIKHEEVMIPEYIPPSDEENNEDEIYVKDEISIDEESHHLEKLYKDIQLEEVAKDVKLMYETILLDQRKAFVYTTKLDDMTVFAKNIDCQNFPDLLERVETESKPNFNGFTHNSANSIGILNIIEDKLDEYNKLKSRRKYQNNAVKWVFNDSKLNQIPIVVLEDMWQSMPDILNTLKNLDPCSDGQIVSVPLKSYYITIRDKYCKETRNYQIVNSSIETQIVTYHRYTYCKDETDMDNLVDLSNAINYNYTNCCWHKGQKNVMNIEKEILSRFPVNFIFISHRCLPGQCSCCCSKTPSQNIATLPKVDTKTDEETSIITKINENRGCFQNISENLVHKNKPKTFDKDLTDPKKSNNRIVMNKKENNVLAIRNSDEEIEIYQAGVQYCVKRSEMNNLGLGDIKPETACCWYKRESIINHSNMEVPIRNLARRSHGCAQRCVCCCKNISSKRKCWSFTLINKTQFDNDAKNQIFKTVRLKADSVTKKILDNKKIEPLATLAGSKSISPDKEFTKNASINNSNNKNSHMHSKLIHVIQNHKLVKTYLQSSKAGGTQAKDMVGFTARKVEDKSLLNDLRSYQFNKKNESISSIGKHIKPLTSSSQVVSVQLSNPLISTQSIIQTSSAHIRSATTPAKSISIQNKAQLKKNTLVPSKINQPRKVSIAEQTQDIVIENLNVLPKQNQIFDSNKNLLTSTCDYCIQIYENGNIVAKLRYPLETYSIEKLKSMSAQISSLKNCKMKTGKYFFTSKLNIHDPTGSASSYIKETVNKFVSVKKQKYCEAFRSYTSKINVEYATKFKTSLRENEVSTLRQNTPKPVTTPWGLNKPVRTFEEEFLNSFIENRSAISKRFFHQQRKRKSELESPKPFPKIRVLAPSEIASVPIDVITKTPALEPNNSVSYDIFKRPVNKEEPSVSNMIVNTENLEPKLNKQVTKKSPLLKQLLVSPCPLLVAPGQQYDDGKAADNTEIDISNLDVIEID